MLRYIVNIFCILTLVSSPQISYALGINDGLVGWWKFDEGSGTLAIDNSGNGISGTLTNGPSWVSGKRISAIDLDGINDYVITSSAPVTAVPLTITYWVYLPASLSGSGVVVWLGEKQANTWRAFYSVISTAGSVSATIVQNNSFGGATSSDGVISTGIWHQVGCVYETNLQTLYVDGVSVATATHTAVPTGVNSFVIGADFSQASVGNLLTGKVDDVRIYNRALSSTEIAILANNRNQIRNAGLNNGQVK